jgi:hypothetical protein
MLPRPEVIESCNPQGLAMSDVLMLVLVGVAFLAAGKYALFCHSLIRIVPAGKEVQR